MYNIQHGVSSFYMCIICVANINSVYSCVYEWFYIHIKLTRKKFKNMILNFLKIIFIKVYKGYSRLMHVHKAIYRTINVVGICRILTKHLLANTCIIESHDI